jgi:hypothetical protein
MHDDAKMRDMQITRTWAKKGGEEEQCIAMVKGHGIGGTRMKTDGRRYSPTSRAVALNPGCSGASVAGPEAGFEAGFAFWLP